MSTKRQKILTLTFNLQTKAHEITIIVSSSTTIQMIKKIAVLSATDNQRGGVVRELLKDSFLEDPRHHPQPQQ
jgi:hypothetical protein